MAFQVSPGVNISEIDLTTVVPAVSTTEGGIAGLFRWGPIEDPVLIDSEDELVATFGKPTSMNYETFFTAASFLAYGNKLYVVRTANTTETFSALAANAAPTANASTTFKNRDDYEDRIGAGLTDANALFSAKWAGELGNSLKVSICDTANAYSRNFWTATGANTSEDTANVTFTVGSNSATVLTPNAATSTTTNNALTVGDILRVGNSTIGYQDLKISTFASDGANVDLTFKTSYALATNLSITSNTATTAANITRYWEYYKNVDRAPGTSTFVSERGGSGDELHVVVADEDGTLTGLKDQILEVFEGVSRATDALNERGSSNYYRTIINQQSQYMWWTNHRGGATYANTAANMAGYSSSVPATLSFQSGADGTAVEGNVAVNVLTAGYDLFARSEDIDISLILAGKARAGTNETQVANYIIDNVCEVRKDCVVFISPDDDDCVNNKGAEADDIVAFRNSLNSSSYAFVDSGYKYAYDKYNDVYRYVPLNGDIAGLAVRTDTSRDPWYSFAGYNRGRIKNVIKLAYNPSKADRDILYKADVNPVVTFPGQGTLLFGDKTALGKPSAFDRINVRRLFIVLEKAIATAAKFSLFEFNDPFTRAQFRNLVEPFLRDVQGRRGITDFRVVCDETNNTGEVIDRNEFIGDIYIKPARSINFIQLNFVAVRTNVEFNEIVGKF